jgi:dihydroxycyclohexadiene carboxylate dehydrogenase
MIHPGRFDDKVAVVTGAAQGIGLSVATSMAKEGAKVALVDRSELVHEVAEKLAAGGANTVALVGDLERYGDCSAVMTRTREQFGRIDILVNNVGGTIWARPYAEYTEEQIEAEIRRSLFPTLWCCRAVLPIMVEHQRGTIVNVSSVATRGVNRVPYGAAKGGVNAITTCLAWEYAGQGIRVVGTAPGGTDAPERRVARGPGAKTKQEKAWYQQIVDQTVNSSLFKRYGTVEEQAAVILFLASDEASYVTGVTVPVAGGDLG